MKDPEFIIFGGSFDPPHLGHCELLKAVRERYRNATTVIIPSFNPVAHPGQVKQVQASFEARVELCALAFHEFLENKTCFISNVEQSLPRPSYTIRTLEALQKQYYPQRAAFLLGQDQLAHLGRWYQAGDLLNELDIIVATRSENSSKTTRQAECLKVVTSLAQELSLGPFQASPQEILFPQRSLRFSFLDEVHVEISSSQIRNLIAKGEKYDHLLPTMVAQYLTKNNYYDPEKGD